MLSILRKLKMETIRLKIRNGIYLPATCKLRQRGLKVTDFTIISNNCWGGTVYESYGLRKESPTIGMFIMPSDYVRFCKNLDYYLTQDLVFIDPEDSKWAETLKDKSNWGTYLIARLDDIELHMLHYHNEAIARSKWTSRVQRVHHDHLIFKFNDQNGATEQDLADFDELQIPNKVIFTAHEHPDLRCAYKIHCPRKAQFIAASYEPFGHNRSFNVTRFINKCFSSHKAEEACN